MSWRRPTVICSRKGKSCVPETFKDRGRLRMLFPKSEIRGYPPGRSGAEALRGRVWSMRN